MKIGMIIFSETGNTYSVALKLQEKLIAAGHSVNLERVEPVGEVRPGARDVQFKSRPDPTPYDAVIFGSPVQAFSLAPAMKSYLAQVGSLQGKKVAFLVTQHLPYKWLGGNRAIRQMSKLCEAKGATICGSGIVNWSRRDRDQQISEVVDRLGRCFV